jgi:mannose-1-phosphate guanylyltransferase
MRHAVIMAGGSGTRLWPLSRRERPKQLLHLFDQRSLLQLARARLQGLFEPRAIWIVTAGQYVDAVAAELPDIPRDNILGEPQGRDTANAIGLALHVLLQRDPQATMAVFTADHLIEPPDAFAAAIRAGLDAAEATPDALVTFGIRPREANPAYGYLRRGSAVRAGVYAVDAYLEKPSREAAESFVRSGGHLWNSGMFAWRLEALRAEFRRLLPENDATLSELARDWPRSLASEEGRRRFAALPRTSIDYGVMEKACRVLVVEMDVRWMDLGSWSALAATRAADERGNVSLAPRSLTLEADGNILVSESEHLLVALGVRDLIIVHAGDATLVCHRDFEQQIKELAALRQRRYGEQYE